MFRELSERLKLAPKNSQFGRGSRIKIPPQRRSASSEQVAKNRSDSPAFCPSAEGASEKVYICPVIFTRLFIILTAPKHSSTNGSIPLYRTAEKDHPSTQDDQTRPPSHEDG